MKIIENNDESSIILIDNETIAIHQSMNFPYNQTFFTLKMKRRLFDDCR